MTLEDILQEKPISEETLILDVYVIISLLLEILKLAEINTKNRIFEKQINFPIAKTVRDIRRDF